MGPNLTSSGTDLRFIKEDARPKWNNLIAALVLIRPKGHGLYKAAEPEPLLPRLKQRKLCFKENLKLEQKYKANKHRIYTNSSNKLLSALHSEDYIKGGFEVRFPGFTVHVGGAIEQWIFSNIERLLLPDEDRTLVLYYNGGPSPMHLADIQFPFGHRNTWKYMIKPVNEEWRRSGRRNLPLLIERCR